MGRAEPQIFISSHREDEEAATNRNAVWLVAKVRGGASRRAKCHHLTAGRAYFKVLSSLLFVGSKDFHSIFALKLGIVFISLDQFNAVNIV